MSRFLRHVGRWTVVSLAAINAFILTGCRELGNLRRINHQQELRILELDRELAGARDQRDQLLLEKEREIRALEARVAGLSRPMGGGSGATAPLPAVANAYSQEQIVELKTKLDTDQAVWEREKNTLETTIAAALQEIKNLREEKERLQEIASAPAAGANIGAVNGRFAASVWDNANRPGSSSFADDRAPAARLASAAASRDGDRAPPSAPAINWQRVEEDLRYLLADPLAKKQAYLLQDFGAMRVVVWSRLVYAGEDRIASHIEPFLKAVGEVFGREPDGQIRIMAHGDLGDPTDLTSRQADAVLRFLIEKTTIRSDRVRAEGMGSRISLPPEIAADAPPASVRRVEIILRARGD